MSFCGGGFQVILRKLFRSSKLSFPPQKNKPTDMKHNRRLTTHIIIQFYIGFHPDQKSADLCLVKDMVR